MALAVTTCRLLDAAADGGGAGSSAAVAQGAGSGAAGGPQTDAGGEVRGQQCELLRYVPELYLENALNMVRDNGFRMGAEVMRAPMQPPKRVRPSTRRGSAAPCGGCHPLCLQQHDPDSSPIPTHSCTPHAGQRPPRCVTPAPGAWTQWWPLWWAG